MVYKNPEDMTLDEIKEQLAIYRTDSMKTYAKMMNNTCKKARCWTETRTEETN